MFLSSCDTDVANEAQKEASETSLTPVILNHQSKGVPVQSSSTHIRGGHVATPLSLSVTHTHTLSLRLALCERCCCSAFSCH